MAEESSIPTDAIDEAWSAADEEASVTPGTKLTPSQVPWSQLWQLPVLLVGVGLFAAGLWLAAQDGEEPDFVSALDQVKQYTLAGNLEAAEERLEVIGSAIDQAPRPQQGRYWQYWADVNYLNLMRDVAAPDAAAAFDEPFETIAEYYQRAERLDHPLEAAAIRRLATVYATLGRGREALALVDRLPIEQPRQRYLIVRDLIERRLAHAGAGDPDLAPLLVRFEEELARERLASARREHEVWITAVRARRLLAGEDHAEAIRLLHARILKFTADQGDGDLASLYLLLARAYQHQDRLDPRDLENAEHHYRQADARLDRGDPMRAEVLVGLGRLALAGDEQQAIQQAHELFTQAVRLYPSHRAAVEAWIGKGDCEARLGNHALAHESFARAAERLMDAPADDPRKALLEQTVRLHVTTANEKGEYERALALLDLLMPVYAPDPPAAMLLELADTHRRIAEAKLKRAGRVSLYQDDAGPEALTPQAARQANQEAAIHFDKAAEFFLRHAQAVTLSDSDAYAESLWNAARAFDRAQNWDQAIETYARFVRTHETDPRLLEARSQLGRSLLAAGQPHAALEQFDHLVKHHPQAPETIDALVPRALAHLEAGERDAALRQLKLIVENHDAIRPDSASYREAVIELGKLHARMGRQDPDYFVPAIERLTESVERYGDRPEAALLRFELADAYRLSVAALRDRLSELRSQREQLENQAEQRRRLSQAQVFYNQVITELETRRPETLSSVERLALRNSYFYQADCAFDREQYELAIELYGKAAERWRRDPSALIARVQIVNAYSELGRVQDARAANRIALNQLERMPEDAFEDGNLPMTKRHWEDWLRWTNEHNLASASAQGG